MKLTFLVIGLLTTSTFSLYGQSNYTHQAYVEVGGIVSSATHTPFWLQANQFGIIPKSSPTGTLRAGLAGAISLTDTTHKASSRAWIVRYGAEVVGNAGTQSQLLAPEYYIKLSHRRIEFVVGRRKEVIGLVDTTLTSGSYAWSGNALPIPKIQFGTKGFAPLGRKQWLAINAFIAHGWFANTDYMQHSYLHQKSLILRIGKPVASIRGYIGINHNVQWAGHSDYIDPRLAADGQLPNQLSDYPNVLFAIRTGGLNNPRITSFDYTNLYGNHVGSIDFGVELRLPATQLMLYHQHSYDDASGMFFQNAPDGLSGLRIRPLHKGLSSFHIDDLLIEYLSTLNQSGPTFYQDNTHTKGADNYFNNGQYSEGWVYKNRIIGTPFISLQSDVRPENQHNTTWAVNNNRVQMAHLAMRSTIARRISLMAKLSFSRNLGAPGEPLPGSPTQFSSLIQVESPLNWVGGMSFRMAVAADVGQLYPNAIGGYIGLRKQVWHR
ncbi:capsule assembly Wzi family protein [Spirosoma gilvum]